MTSFLRLARRSAAARFAPALLIGTALALAGAGSLAFAGDDDDEATAFTRFREGKDGHSALEVAHATYKSDKTGVKVVLYGVVHIADPAYYKKVQKDLDSMDVVLYEGVTPSEKQKKDESMKALGEMQGMMGDLLGLQFQKDGINYKAKNLVHADMTLDELEKATGGDLSKLTPMGKLFSDPNMVKQIAPLMKMFRSLGKQFMKSNPALRDGLKSQMARQLGNADVSQLPGGEEMARVLITERNKVAVSVLDKELEKHESGRIAIFYGAAHMKDFHDRLTARGFRQAKKTWLPAWTIGGGGDEEDDGDETPAPRSEEKERSREPETVPPSKSGKRWF